MRRHFLPLTEDELLNLPFDDYVLAPFHKGARLPCRGCKHHKLDLVALVSFRMVKRAFLDRLESEGNAQRFNILAVEISDSDLGYLLSSDLNEARAVVCTYETDGGEIELLIAPPVMHREFAEKEGWGHRLTLEELSA